MKRCIPLFAALGLSVMILGCKADSTALQALDPAEAQHIEERGDNSIYGFAFLKNAAGDKLTCAGLPVTLLPASSYADDIMTKVYSGTKKGFSDKEADIETLDHLFERYRRESICNRNGEFRFIDVPDGDYYVVALMNLDPAMEEEGYSREHQREHFSRGDDYKEHRDHRYAMVQRGPGPVLTYGTEPKAPESDEAVTPWPTRGENPNRGGRRHEGTLMQRVFVEKGETARLTMTR